MMIDPFNILAALAEPTRLAAMKRLWDDQEHYGHAEPVGLVLHHFCGRGTTDA
jgi:hypothetical protein